MVLPLIGVAIGAFMLLVAAVFVVIAFTIVKGALAWVAMTVAIALGLIAAYSFIIKPLLGGQEASTTNLGVGIGLALFFLVFGVGLANVLGGPIAAVSPNAASVATLPFAAAVATTSSAAAPAVDFSSITAFIQTEWLWGAVLLFVFGLALLIQRVTKKR